MKTWGILAATALLLAAAGAGEARPGRPGLLFQESQTKKLPPAADHSPGVEELMRLGMPAPDRPWLPEDLGKAVIVCRKLLQEDGEKLPRQDSKTSGLVFSRLASKENLAPALDGKAPGEGRFPLLIQWMGQVVNMLKIYLEATMNGKAFDAEVTELSALQGVLWAPCLEMAGEFVKGVDPADPNRDSKLAGFEQMKKGMSTGVSGFLTMIGDRDGYIPRHRLRLIRSLKPDLARLRNFMGPQSQRELPVRLEAILKEETDPEVREALQDLRHSLD